MYYLRPREFLELAIIYSIVFVPIIIVSIILCIISFEIKALIILLVSFALYLLIMFICWKVTRNKDCYLLVKENGLEMVIEGLSGKEKLELKYNQIIKIEYYKITSITNWIFVFFQFFCIRCAYITYIANAEEVTKLIGCLSYKEIKEIAQKTNIKLKVH